VHLEMVSDMTTDKFINALMRMGSRKGFPCEIYSDNAKQLKKADKEIRALFKALQARKLPSSLETCTWNFIPDRAPHWGGFYERMIKTAKCALKKTVGKAKLDADQLRTCLCQIEATMNARPLSAVSETANELLPVTPSKLLLAYDTTGPGTPSQRDTSAPAQQWKRRMRLGDVYWSAWRKDYQQNLIKFKKWHMQKPNLKAGDIVLVSEPSVKRDDWPLGRIEEVDISKDGKVRSVQVRTAQGVLRRAIHYLVPLECDSDTTSTTSRPESSLASPLDAAP